MGKNRLDSGRRPRPGVVAKRNKQRSNRAFYLVLIAIAVAGLATLGYLSTRSSSNAAIVSQIDTTLPPVKSQGYVIGTDSAPIEVTEFGDFECPSCARFATLTEPDVRSRLVNTGKIRLRFIDFPIPGHRNTWDASRAAACADQQGKFWEMHDLLYQTQDQWNSEATDNPSKIIKGLARQLHLNTDQFDRCVDTKAMQAKIQAHAKVGEQRRIRATPSFIIGGKVIEGAPPGGYDEFKKLVDQAIADATIARQVPDSSTLTRKR